MTGCSSKRILVTGGAGFMGSHLCTRLLDQGHEVLCIDNYVTGRPPNVAHLLSTPRFELIHHDVTSPLFIEIDEIYNLACPASPAHYQADPVQTIKTNVHGTLNVLDLAKRTGARVLQASTSEVYGDPGIHPQTELYWGNVNPIGPRACYNEGKRCAETLFFDYHNQHEVDIKVARIFNTYGPRMRPDDGRVMPNFIMQAFRGEHLTIHGDGLQTRSFCYIDDMVDGLIRLMASPKGITGPINLGNPREITVLDLAREVITEVGSTSDLRYTPLPRDDPRQRCPDITLGRKVLGWEPTTPLTEGLKLTVAYFRQSNQAMACL